MDFNPAEAARALARQSVAVRNGFVSPQAGEPTLRAYGLELLKAAEIDISKWMKDNPGLTTAGAGLAGAGLGAGAGYLASQFRDEKERQPMQSALTGALLGGGLGLGGAMGAQYLQGMPQGKPSNLAKIDLEKHFGNKAFHGMEGEVPADLKEERYDPATDHLANEIKWRQGKAFPSSSWVSWANDTAKDYAGWPYGNGLGALPVIGGADALAGAYRRFLAPGRAGQSLENLMHPMDMMSYAGKPVTLQNIKDMVTTGLGGSPHSSDVDNLVAMNSKDLGKVMAEGKGIPASAAQARSVHTSTTSPGAPPASQGVTAEQMQRLHTMARQDEIKRPGTKFSYGTPQHLGGIPPEWRTAGQTPGATPTWADAGKRLISKTVGRLPIAQQSVTHNRPWGGKRLGQRAMVYGLPLALSAIRNYTGGDVTQADLMSGSPEVPSMLEHPLERMFGGHNTAVAAARRSVNSEFGTMMSQMTPDGKPISRVTGGDDAERKRLTDILWGHAKDRQAHPGGIPGYTIPPAKTREEQLRELQGARF